MKNIFWRRLSLIMGIAIAMMSCMRIAPKPESSISEIHSTSRTPGNWWKPVPGTSWQWQLSGDIDPTLEVQMYDIDLFDAPQAVIDQLHANGRVVICYFSAGTYEDWRSDRTALAIRSWVTHSLNGPGSAGWISDRSIC